MRFSNDVAECNECSDIIIAGYGTAYELDGKTFCCGNCILDYLKMHNKIKVKTVNNDNTTCEVCSDLFEKDDEAIEYDGHTFHEEDCLVEYLEETVPTRTLYTAKDREDIYGDMLYDQWKDDNL